MCDFHYSFQFQKCDMLFDLLWKMKSSVRETLRHWLLAYGVPCKIAENCANACSEMVENCIKYARGGSMAGVNIRVEEGCIAVETTNQTDKRHQQQLKESILALDNTTDLPHLFVQKLMNSTEGVSQLGLVKIMMETRGMLELLPVQHRDMARIRLSMNIDEAPQEEGTL